MLYIKHILPRLSILIIGIYFIWLGYNNDYYQFFGVIFWLGISFVFSGLKVAYTAIFSIRGQSSTRNSNQYTSAKENPNLTRFYRRSCSNCNQISEHEIARISAGSSKAYVTCGSCGYWKEEAW